MELRIKMCASSGLKPCLFFFENGRVLHSSYYFLQKQRQKRSDKLLNQLTMFVSPKTYMKLISMQDLNSCTHSLPTATFTNSQSIICARCFKHTHRAVTTR